MNEYRASVVYNPYTLRKLNTVISGTFRYGLKMFYVGVCVALLVAGAMSGLQTPKGVAMICIACFLFPSVRAIDKNRAEQALRKMNGKTLKVEYTFGEDGFRCEAPGEKAEFTYDSIVRLVEQPDFLYLFPNASQAYMVDLSTLEEGKAEPFKAFLSEKVGLEWTKPVSLLTFNLKPLRFNRKNTRLPR